MNIADKLSVAMGKEAIRIAEERLNRPLPEKLKANICLPKWGYMGLEMIIDTVRTIEVDDLEQYLVDLDN